MSWSFAGAGMATLLYSLSSIADTMFRKADIVFDIFSILRQSWRHKVNGEAYEMLTYNGDTAASEWRCFSKYLRIHDAEINTSHVIWKIMTSKSLVTILLQFVWLFYVSRNADDCIAIGSHMDDTVSSTAVLWCGNRGGWVSYKTLEKYSRLYINSRWIKYLHRYSYSSSHIQDNKS